MSNRSVSIIQVQNLWFFADFTQTSTGWDVVRLKFAGFDKNSCINRAMVSAQSRNLPFSELDFSPLELSRLLHEIEQKTAYRKAKRFLQKSQNQPEQKDTGKSKTKNKQTSSSTLKSDAGNCSATLPLAVETTGEDACSTEIPQVSYTGDIATVYFDGSSHGNPGISGAATVIDLPTGETRSFSEFIPSANSSVAEYSAAILGLQKALDIGCKHIILKGDCQQIITYLLEIQISPKKQGNHLDTLHDSAFSLLKKFDYVKIEWLPRKQNQRADSEVRRVIEANQPKSKKATTNTSKSAKTKNKVIKTDSALKLLYNMSLPPMPPLPHLAEQINQMIPLGLKAPIHQYESLKSGWDEFSSKRLPTLIGLVPDVVKKAINDTLPQAKPEDQAKIYRWILRGLPAFMAVRKLEVDANTSKQVVKALRRSGRI